MSRIVYAQEAGHHKQPFKSTVGSRKISISKKLFRVAFSRKSVVGIAFQRVGPVTYELIPDGYHPEWLKEPRVSPKGNVHVYINNPELFWQSPTGDEGIPHMIQKTATDKP